MASRRRRQKSIGSVVNDVKRRVTNIEKRPGATRLKRNVVTGEKIQYRTVPTKAIQSDAITANEAAFGVPIVSDTQPTDYLKAGTLWYDTTSNAASIYSSTDEQFLLIKDAAAQASADGKNTIYRQTSQPTGGTYVTGDTWFDEDDNNKIYRYDGTSWVGLQLGGNGLANINANSINTGTLNASLVTVSNLDAGSITTGTLSAITIRGNTIQQGTSGNYILMDQTNKATIKFFVTGYTNPGYISVESSYGGTLGQLSLRGPTTGSEADPASIGLYGENMYLDAGYINIESTGNFSLGNSSDGIQIKYDITTPAGGASYVNSIRNIWHSPNSYTPGSLDGNQGDVWLTY